MLTPERKLVQATVFLLQEDKTLETGIQIKVENAVIPFLWAREVTGKVRTLNQYKLNTKQNHRITECSAKEGTSVGHLLQPHC